jgi:hypothetical protein
MEVKYTPQYLAKLEELFAESDYQLRYEKGQFKSGYCVLKEHKVAVVNKYYTLEGKINCLIEIIRTVSFDTRRMTEKSHKLLTALTQTKLSL